MSYGDPGTITDQSDLATEPAKLLWRHRVNRNQHPRRHGSGKVREVIRPGMAGRVHDLECHAGAFCPVPQIRCCSVEVARPHRISQQAAFQARAVLTSVEFNRNLPVNLLIYRAFWSD